MIIYCALNTANGKRYIGLTTVSLKARWSSHCLQAKKGGKTALGRAIRKYGAEAFVVEEIAHLMPGLPVQELYALERELIAQEGTKRPKGYNLTDGGEGIHGYKFDPDLVERISEKKRGRASPPKTAEGIQRLKDAWTPARRERHSTIMRELRSSGKCVPPLERGQEMSETERANRSAANKAIAAARSSEQRAALVARMTALGYARAGITESAEIRAKRKAIWTPERRAAQAERARYQRLRAVKLKNDMELH